MANMISAELANQIAEAEVGARTTLTDVKVGDKLKLVGIGTYLDRSNVAQPQFELSINNTPKLIRLGIKGFANMKIFQGALTSITGLKFNTELKDSEIVILKDIMLDETTKKLLLAEELVFECVHAVTVVNFLSEVENEPKLAPRYYNGYSKFQKARRAAMDENDQRSVNACWDDLYMSGVKDGINVNDVKLHDTTPVFKIQG